MRYYAVFDTNVLVSALLTKNEDAATVLVLRAVADREIVPLYSEDILREYDEVLHRAKFPFSESHIRDLLLLIRQFGLSVSPGPTGEVLPYPDDLIFYEVVMEKREDDAYLHRIGVDELKCYHFTEHPTMCHEWGCFRRSLYVIPMLQTKSHPPEPWSSNWL